MKRLAAVIASACILAPAATAAAAYYPQPWVTKQLGNSCSVTAMGIERVVTTPNHFELSFGGGTSCAGAVGNKNLVVELQIKVPHKGWSPEATIRRSNFRGNPLRLVSSINIAGSGASHQYRIAATATDTRHGVTRTGTVFSKVLTA